MGMVYLLALMLAGKWSWFPRSIPNTAWGYHYSPRSKGFPSQLVLRADVEREVKHNDKQRFSLWLEKGIKRIRANQGHKMKEASWVRHTWNIIGMSPRQWGGGQWAADTHLVFPGASRVQPGIIWVVAWLPSSYFQMTIMKSGEFGMIWGGQPPRYSWHIHEALASQEEELRGRLASHQAWRVETHGAEPHSLRAPWGLIGWKNGPFLDDLLRINCDLQRKLC